MSKAGLLERLRSVEDPELPVSIVDLGMVRDVVVDDDGRVHVTLVPTFLGCPAQLFIEAAVVEALASEARGPVDVRWSSDAWDLDALTPLAQEQLRSFGIAVPDNDSGRAQCPHCGTGELVVENEFGSTVCRKLAYCRECQTPAEIMKGPAVARPVPVTVRLVSDRQ